MKILLADDHTLFRDALVEYMRRADENNEVLVAEDYPNAKNILDENADVDLTLLDFKMPGMNGLEGLKDLHQCFPDMPIALLSGVAEERHVRKAMEYGARGFFPKTLSGKAMMKAIDLILTGEKFLPIDDKSNKLQPSYYGGSEHEFHESEDQTFQKEEDPGLTKREKEVLEYLVKGASNKDIARALDLQIVTIKLHVRGICKKLDAKNRTQAALRAQKMRIA